jgi:hypothetical protein
MGEAHAAVLDVFSQLAEMVGDFRPGGIESTEERSAERRMRAVRAGCPARRAKVERGSAKAMAAAPEKAPCIRAGKP